MEITPRKVLSLLQFKMDSNNLLVTIEEAFTTIRRGGSTVVSWWARFVPKSQ